MNILSITAQKPHSTGSGTYMTGLVRAFDRMGHRQAVVCGIFPDDRVEFPEGVACYPVFFTEKHAADLSAAPCRAAGPDFDPLPFPVVGMSDIMPYESTRYRDLTAEMVSEFEDAFIGTEEKAGAVRRAIEDLDPDLIICHHLFLLTALVRKNFPDRRIIGISHGTDLRQMVNCSDLRGLVRPHIAKLDMALALHEDQRVRIMDLFGLDESGVAVIGSGYNNKLFNTDGRAERKAGDPVRICYAGKISRPKGVPELLKALSLLSGNVGLPPFEFSMAGGCQDDDLKGSLSDLPEYAAWLGHISQPALAELLRRTDIFVLPSYFEGLPLVLIEAMASGAVPVSTDLPGVRPWIDANVSHPNVLYVDMPEMKSIDEPTDEGRDAFVNDLYSVLKAAVNDVYEGRLPGTPPDTSGITWDGLSSELLKIFFDRSCHLA